MNFIKRSLILVSSLAVIAVTLSGPTNFEANTKPIFTPATSVAALGDSISQAANSCGATPNNCPENSWSTGSNPAVKSDAQRLQSLQSGKHKIAVYNDAQSGSTTFALQAQAAVAVTQQPELVTILSGANDLCTGTVDQMTSVQNFAANMKTALNTISTGLPSTKIFMSSIPNLKNLFQAGLESPIALQHWQSAYPCQSLLAYPTSNTAADIARRQTVYERETAFNSAIMTVCAEYKNCFTDKGALSHAVFASDEISTVDYFHPNIAGQKKIAAVSWNSFPKKSILINRGSDPRNRNVNAPKVFVISPKPNEKVSGTAYYVAIKVLSKKPLKTVYLNTQLGNFPLNYQNGVWTVTVNTTLAPNGFTTTFSAVAVTVSGETGVSANVTVTDNN